MSLNWRICHAYIRSCSPLSFHRRLRPAVLAARQASTAAPGYPPYNIERTGENDYRITVAVAGFARDELSIEAKENTLTIKGDKRRKERARAGEVLYQGIAARAFERVFQLADYRHGEEREP